MNFSDKGKNSSYIFHRLLQSTKPHCLRPIVSVTIFLTQSNDAPIKMYHPDREERHEEGLAVPSWKEVGENHQKKKIRLRCDSGMVVVVFIIIVLLTLLFGMLSSVNNPWCHLLFPNGTVMY